MHERIVVAFVTSPECRLVSRIGVAAISVTFLAVGASAQMHKMTTDPHDTGYIRGERDAERRANNEGARSSFRPLLSWVRMDIGKLRTRTARLAQSVGRPAPDLRSARKEAGRVSKHSRTAARWLQGPRASRPHVEPQVGPPRDLETTLGDIETIECLVSEVSTLSLQATMQLDVSRHVATLDKLERIEALARQVEVDLRGR
jgi:hypothetical protein